MNGHNRSNHIFEIVVSKYILKGPVDFDNEKWDEGTFLVWDGDDLLASRPDAINTRSKHNSKPRYDFR